VIACGALSGFHALIASGTTPKMIDRESDVRPIGYGAMLLEGFVSLTALIAACSLEPGDYFKINTEKGQYEQLVVDARRQYGWDLRPREFDRLKAEAGVKEDLSGRTAGAVTLALGMAKVLANLPGMRTLTAYLYHFVIMFEALFILTLLETGTRVTRFILQELWQGAPSPRVSAAETAEIAAAHKTHWTFNVVTSLIVSSAWGYLLYVFEIGRLWLLMGVANQLLAAIGLAVGTTYLLRHAPKRAYALCTAIPFAVVVVTVFAAGLESLNLWWLRQAIPTLALDDVFSYRLMCGLVSVILLLGAVIVIGSVRRWMLLLAKETVQPAA
jgi:carbon starvation protein